MALDESQQDRLTRLYYSFINWYGKNYDTGGLVLDEEHADDWVTIVDDQLWGDFSDRSMFDEYAQANPDNLSPENLATVMSWKDAVYGRFGVMDQDLEGSFCFMLRDDYAFTVTPHSEEIAESLSSAIPVIVMGALLPFEGLITFTSLTFQVTLDSQNPYIKELTSTLPAIEQRGDYIHNAFELALNSRRIADDLLAMEAEDLLRTQKTFEEADKRTGSQHRGPLAGLSTEERAQRLMLQDQTARDLETLRTISALVTTAATLTSPVTLEKAYLSLTEDELKRVSSEAGIPGAQELGAKELATELASRLPLDPTRVFQRLIVSCAYGVDTLSKLIKAGGMLEISIDTLRENPHLAHPLFPYSLIVKSGDALNLTMASDVYEALSVHAWDRFVEREADIERRIAYLMLALDYRGVTYLEPLLDEIENLIGAASAPGSLELAIRERGLCGKFGFAYIKAPEGDAYVADPIMAKLCRPDENGVPRNTEPLMLASEIAKHGGVRPLDFLTVQGDILASTETEPVYQELLSWLDEHVPQGADDLHFASDTANQLVRTLRYAAGPSEAFHVFYDVGLDLNQAQAARMADFVNRLSQVIPNWQLGGWRREDGVF